MGTVSLGVVSEISTQILIKNGIPAKDAAIVADTILDAHRKGRHTHGIGRLPIYVRRVKENLMSAETIMKPVSDTPLVTVYDAQNGFGQVAAYRGMTQCIEKAALHGVGVVANKEANSFGTAGYYGELAAKRGMISIVMGNASPAIAPTGGSRAILGTNPICFSFPGTANNKPIILDMACSVVARGKIRLAAKNGEKIPFGWALDSNGNPTDDPNAAIKGTLNAIGGHKGFGLALVADILAGLLSGSAFAGDAKALDTPSGPSRCGHFFAVINPEFFISREEYEERIDYLIERIKACGEPGGVFMPGEIEYLHETDHSETVELSAGVIDDVNRLAEDSGIELRL